MVTIEDVARISGVSAMTVSRVLNNPEKVKKATLDKINGVIKQIGYSPNLLAKGLVSGSSKTIGIISSNMYNQAYTDIIVAIEKIAYSNGFMIVNANVNTSADAMQALDRFINSRVDGIILLPLEMNMAEIPDYKEALIEGDIFLKYFKKKCTEQHVNAVSVSQKIEGIPDVSFDFGRQCELSLEFLLNKGYKDIAMINSILPEGLWKEKEDKYVEIMQKNGLSEYILIEKEVASIKKSRVAAEKLLSRHVPRAVYCANDNMAAGVLQIIHEKGFAIPDQIAVMGNDDMYICNAVYPELTTVALGSAEAGEKAISNLFNMIAGEVVTDCKVSPYLVERKSV